MRLFVASQAVEDVREVWASSEAKAIEAAGLLAARFGLPVRVHPGLGENDRTSTGFLPPTEFEDVADAFFARPLESIRGWETATAAQSRVQRALEEVLEHASGAGDIAIIAHGAVGTLLMCAMLGQPISRKLDQPFQGHFWSFNRNTRLVVHQWRPVAPR
jgi:broad specificity phosphatase PhoE